MEPNTQMESGSAIIHYKRYSIASVVLCMLTFVLLFWDTISTRLVAFLLSFLLFIASSLGTLILAFFAARVRRKNALEIQGIYQFLPRITASGILGMIAMFIAASMTETVERPAINEATGQLSGPSLSCAADFSSYGFPFPYSIVQTCVETLSPYESALATAGDLLIWSVIVFVLITIFEEIKGRLHTA